MKDDYKFVGNAIEIQVGADKNGKMVVLSSKNDQLVEAMKKEGELKRAIALLTFILSDLEKIND